MATVRRANDFRNFFRQLAREVQDESIREAFGRPFLTDLAEQALDRIRQRTQGSGFGVLNGRQRRLRPLAQVTRDTRTFYRSAGILSGRTSPATSNLTETGQMFESLTYSLNLRNRSIRLFFDNTEADRKAQAVSVRRPFFALTNNDITEYVGFSQSRLARVVLRRTRNL